MAQPPAKYLSVRQAKAAYGAALGVVAEAEPREAQRNPSGRIAYRCAIAVDPEKPNGLVAVDRVSVAAAIALNLDG